MHPTPSMTVVLELSCKVFHSLSPIKTSYMQRGSKVRRSAFSGSMQTVALAPSSQLSIRFYPACLHAAAFGRKLIVHAKLGKRPEQR